LQQPFKNAITQSTAMHVDFYFDFSSPYSYIAAEKMDALVESYGLEVRWKPFLLGVILKTTGTSVLTVGHEWKASYSMTDFQRSAEVNGLSYKHPSNFPQSSAIVGRCTLWIEKTYGPSVAKAFTKSVFRMLFIHDGDINNTAALANLAAELAVDNQAMLNAITQPEVKQLLAATTEEASANKIFGAPTALFRGERFWGVDRLAHLEFRLKQALGGKGYKTLLAQANSEVNTLSVEEVPLLSASPDVVLVDLRDPRELEREGLIDGAFHAPRGMLEFWIDPKSPYYKPIFTPDKHFVLFCAGGWRSAVTAQALQNMALLPKISHIDGGFSAWKKSGASVVLKENK
jgi:2-hydroxychromene-2-carboxylate isomerase/rhodanese-related sulfurtransferase